MFCRCRTDKSGLRLDGARDGQHARVFVFGLARLLGVDDLTPWKEQCERSNHAGH
jgi:hypothetical protein